MLDSGLKLIDARSFQDISKILTIPMVIVAYILQNDESLSIFGFTILSLDSTLSQEINFHRLVVIFFGNALVCIIFSYIALTVLRFFSAWALIEKGFPLLRIMSHLLFAFGILGIFGAEKFKELSRVIPFWYYASIVWGFFCIALSKQDGDEGAT